MASRITQSFGFHQSPETFISDRYQRLVLSENQRNPNTGTPIVRAEILNRNVHIISSYKVCKAVLCASEASGENGDALITLSGGDSDQHSSGGGASTLPRGTFAAGPAYEQLMAAFFPPPNLLLEDAERHMDHKRIWRTTIANVMEATIPLIREVTMKSFVKPSLGNQTGRPLDLYETMKSLSWDILFAIFLGINRDDADGQFRKMEDLQETLLRGQFSLFPVSLRTPFWTSARSRGLEAVQQLGPTIRSNLRSRWEGSSSTSGRTSACPFADCISPNASVNGLLNEDDVVSHVRLLTSSIANKALASLLTAFFMNLFLWRNQTKLDESGSLATLIAGQQDPSARKAMLQSVLHETLRLSPPVIGVMRRVTQTVCIDEKVCFGGSPHTIPAGHDAWLYFATANRDPSMFERPGEFIWDRFMQCDESTDCGFAFGLGAKRCLGADLVHQIALTVAQTVMDSGLSIHGEVQEDGVRNWLGWKSDADPKAIARDLKQLPCQRPRRPVMVTVGTQSNIQCP